MDNNRYYEKLEWSQVITMPENQVGFIATYKNRSSSNAYLNGLDLSPEFGAELEYFTLYELQSLHQMTTTKFNLPLVEVKMWAVDQNGKTIGEQFKTDKHMNKVYWYDAEDSEFFYRVDDTIYTRVPVITLTPTYNSECHFDLPSWNKVIVSKGKDDYFFVLATKSGVFGNRREINLCYKCDGLLGLKKAIQEKIYITNDPRYD